MSCLWKVPDPAGWLLLKETKSEQETNLFNHYCFFLRSDLQTAVYGTAHPLSAPYEQEAECP